MLGKVLKNGFECSQALALVQGQSDVFATLPQSKKVTLVASNVALSGFGFGQGLRGTL